MMNLLVVVFFASLASVQGCADSIKYDKFYDFTQKSVEPVLVSRAARSVLLGKVAAPSYYVQQHVPFSGAGCNTQGVLKIVLSTHPAIKGRRVLVDMFFGSNPTGFNFNLGGSPTNNGYAGDASTTAYDAEIHSTNGQNVLGYRADSASVKQAFNYASFFTNRLTLVIGQNNIVLARNVDINYYDLPHMFDLDANNNLYLGINRVIYRPGSRIGTGLCKVGIKFLDLLL